MTVIEKVMALQTVDIFSEVSTEQLSHLAVIAEEVTFQAADVIYKESDPPTAMYFVLEGKVKLHREELEVTIAEANDVFGTWALFDDEPMVVTATPMETTRVLKIDKDDFIDLLADYVQITQGVLKAMVTRLRGLVGRVSPDSATDST